MLLVIDNYDSFVYNLARYFQRLGQETVVYRNDAIDAQTIRALRPDGIVLSPGPCAPSQAGCSLEVVRQLRGEFPLLGICLGHQTIAAALGGEIVRSPHPMHGRTSRVEHTGQGVFAGAPSPLTVCRYHSLIVRAASLPDTLRVTARAEDQTIMALEMLDHPVVGLQFHPESILTEGGFLLLANWLAMAGLPVADKPPSMSSELPSLQESPPTTPEVPVTF